MDIIKIQNFSKTLKSEFKFNYNIKKLNWFNIGGNTEVFFKPDGSTVSFASGEDVVLDGSFTKPPVGTYTHAYVKLDNVFGITSAMQFDASTAGASGTGVHCFTPTAGAQGAHKQSGTHSISVCAGTATTPGKFTETINHWGNPNTASHQPCIVDSTPTSSCGTEGAYLVDTNQFVSTGDDDTDALHGILPFDKPIKVTPQTNTLITRFSVTPVSYTHLTLPTKA